MARLGIDETDLNVRIAAIEQLKEQQTDVLEKIKSRLHGTEDVHDLLANIEDSANTQRFEVAAGKPRLQIDRLEQAPSRINRARCSLKAAMDQ